MKHLLFLLFLAPVMVLSGQCDSSISGIDNNTGYKDRGSHCEGFYRSLVSGVDIQLVQFTKGSLTYSATKAEKISLSVATDTEESIHVRSMGIPRNLFYRMDAVLKKGDSFTWDTGTVLLKNYRTKYARQIGLFGFTGAANNRTFYPVRVDDSDGGLQIKLVASSQVKNIKWRIQDQTDFKTLKGGGSYSSGQPIIIILPSTLSSGNYVIELQGKKRDGITDIGMKPLRIKI